MYIYIYKALDFGLLSDNTRCLRCLRPRCVSPTTRRWKRSGRPDFPTKPPLAALLGFPSNGLEYQRSTGMEIHRFSPEHNLHSCWILLDGPYFDISFYMYNL